MIPLPKLREIRNSVPMSAAELARAAGVSRMTIHHLETGGTAQAATVRKLAKALGVKPADLMEDA